MIQNNSITIFYFIIIIILIILVLYFNIVAGINHVKALEIDIIDNSLCKYQGLSPLNKNNIVRGNYFYKSDNGNYYMLSKDIKYYLKICSQLCGNGITTNGECSTDGNPKSFNLCMEDLKPQSGCTNSAVPLVEDNGVYYYAKSVSTTVPV